MTDHVPQGLTVVQSGGAVLIAVVVLSVLIYLAWKLIILPGMIQQESMAKSNENAAIQHAIAAEANARAARANESTSEANARTAAMLERLTEKFLDAALGQGITKPAQDAHD